MVLAAAAQEGGQPVARGCGHVVDGSGGSVAQLVHHAGHGGLGEAVAAIIVAVAPKGLLLPAGGSKAARYDEGGVCPGDG